MKFVFVAMTYNIILNRNNDCYTISRLNSLTLTFGSDCKIIIVDNNSSEDSIEYLRLWLKDNPHIWAVILTNDKTLTYMECVDLGIAFAMRQDDFERVKILSEDE